jgi:uncharacterized membrane protein YphA (DoxX/SURF4 family)
MSIYVEILIHAPMDDLWSHTQTPALHERWDLRFSRIDYLPKLGESTTQRFRYATRIGFGVEISGEGETLGERESADGSSTSALKFGSDQPLSLIREGSGYWKYVPTRDGIKFLTWYDYQTRFGFAGALFDRLVFHRLIGWATAWSFDRLRLWLEENVDPAVAMRQTLVHAVARIALAVIFAYQGLVPKLLARHIDEISMLRSAGLSPPLTDIALSAMGVCEIGLAAALLFAWRRRTPAWLCLIAMPIATFAVGLTSPSFFRAAFNPFSLNLAVASLALIDLLVLSGVPSAARCLRRPVSDQV